MNRSLKMIAGAAAITLTAALAACGGGGDAASDGDNGELTVYYGTPRDLIKPLFDGFNEAHPDITINEFRQPTEELLSTLQIEFQSGHKRADVVIAPAAQLYALQDSHQAFQAYETEHSDTILESLRDPDNLVNTVGVNLYMLGYNTNHISAEEAPTSWAEALDDQFRDQIAIADPNNSASIHSFIWFVTQHLDGEPFGWDYFEGIGALNPRLESSHGTIRDLVMNGERPLGFLLTENIPPMIEDGAPGGIVWPEEGVPGEPRGASIIEGANNTEAAQLFLDFLHSEEGQRLVAEEYGLVPAREGVDFVFGDGTTLDEIEIIGVDSRFISENREEQASEFHARLTAGGR